MKVSHQIERALFSLGTTAIRSLIFNRISALFTNSAEVVIFAITIVNEVENNVPQV